MKRFAMTLTVLATITGATLAASPAASIHRWGTAFYSEAGQTWEPLLASQPRLSEALSARIGREPAPERAGHINLELLRYVAGSDRLSALESVEFRGGDAWIAAVGQGDPFEIDGTVTVSAGSAAVTGTSTSFLSQCPPGSTLWIAGVRCVVDSLASDTSLTLATAHAAGAVGVTARVAPLWTIEHPLMIAHGVVQDWSLQNDKAGTRFSIGRRPTAETKLFLDRETGFGPAVYFDGGEKATSPSTLDPNGDFTISCRAYHFLERSAALQHLMDCNQIDLYLDSGSRPVIQINTSTGNHTVTGPDSVPDEAFSIITGRYKAADDRLDICVDGEQVNSITSADGTLSTVTAALVMGADHTGTTENLEGVAQEFIFTARYLDDEELLNLASGPLAVSGEFADDDDLLGYWPGEVDTSANLIEAAGTNADSPLDVPLAGSWKRASGLSAEEIAGQPIPRGIGFVEHARAISLMTDAPNLNEQIYKVAAGPIQAIHAVYEAGESQDEGNITGGPELKVLANTYKELLDATLSGATNNEVAWWPQGGVFRMVDRSAGGDVTADISGEGIGMRAMYFDGVDAKVDFGTSINGTVLLGDFSLHIELTLEDTETDGQWIIGNHDTTDGFYVRYRELSGSNVKVIDFGLNSMICRSPELSSGGVLYVFDWVVDFTPSQVLGYLYLNGQLVDQDAIFATPVASTDPLVVGAPPPSNVGANDKFYKGYIGDLGLLTTQIDLDWHKTHLIGDISADSNLVHHWPARTRSFPAVTILDEAGSLNGTISGGFGWHGPLTQTSARGQAELVAREDAALGTPALDFEDLYGATTAPVHLYLAESTEADLGQVLDEILESLNGWRRWAAPAPSVLEGDWSVTAGTAAVTGSSTLALTEISLPAILLLEGEPIPIASIESDTALTLAHNHTAGASAKSATIFEPKLKFGYIQDPEAVTVDATIEAEAVRELVIVLDPTLPEIFRVGYRWIHHVGEEVSQTVAEWRRRLWARELRHASRRHQRNTRLWRALAVQETEPQAPLVVDARFRSPSGAAPEAIRLRDLHGTRRLRGVGTLYDPARAVTPGAYLEIANADLPGDSAPFLVHEILERDAGSSIVKVALWGAKLEV